METSSSNGNGDRLFLCGVFARSARASGGIDKSGGELYEHRCREAGVGGRIGDDVTDMRRDVAHVDGNCPGARLAGYGKGRFLLGHPAHGK